MSAYRVQLKALPRPKSGGRKVVAKAGGAKSRSRPAIKHTPFSVTFTHPFLSVVQKSNFCIIAEAPDQRVPKIESRDTC